MSWLTVKPLLYLSAGLFMACIVLGSGWYSTHAALRVAKATHQAENDKAAREFAEAARKAEQQEAQALNAVAEAYEKGKRDAEETGQRTVADLRAGALKLRKHWAGCETSRLSEGAARAAELDAAQRDREESAGRVVRAAAACDAQVTALQEALRARQ